MPTISLLLGAGFSAPMGYPIGDTLNKMLLNCSGDTMTFNASGCLTISTDGKKPNFGYTTSYEREFAFCRKLISYYNDSIKPFDYEEFYDFMKSCPSSDKNIEKLAGPFLRHNQTVEDLILSLDRIYPQLIEFYLVDKNGVAYYDNTGHMGGPIYSGYTGFLNYIQDISKKFIINVHTLNHDLFFESLNHSDWIRGNLCDGFEELGSPYFGKLDVGGRVYKARLEYYTGKYDKQFRLYKLHGSRDYGVYYSSNHSVLSPEKYLKTRYGIGFGELYKEKVNDKGELEYDNCWINYHSDFLTGTTSKIERYKEPLLYKTLFELFRQNLRNAETLIIIGYGGKDSEVNKILLENFDYKNKKSYIIDPFAGKQIQGLSEKLNSVIIRKHLEVITNEDIAF